ncbi:MAG: TlpA disulfide reductase family protein [Balneolales bacterium]
MMSLYGIMRNICLLFIVMAAAGACTRDYQAETGNPEQPYIERQPVHYKYAPATELPVILNEDGSFRADVPADTLEVVTLHYFNEAYPLLIHPGEPLDVYINRARFPENVTVKGPSAELNELYQHFLVQDQGLRQEIRKELPEFAADEPNDILQIHKNQIELSRDYFEGTPFDIFMYRAIGEYLLRALGEVQIRAREAGYDAEAGRQAVLEEAVEMNFFTLRSLRAQRAGIRDFTDAYSKTFGVKDSLSETYGRELTVYDVLILGYEDLNAARVSVLDHIEEEEALAHAHMYLVAERLGEAPFDKAESTYFEFLDHYAEYDGYAEFLTWHYEGMKSVQPGQPALPFSIEDDNGYTRTMDDFTGKFVLLDFWASWCLPCLHEFPHMQRLYDKYDRDDFEIVAISIEKDRQAWENAVKRYNHPWPQLHDGDEFRQETFAGYRGGGIPFYILIGRDGRIERRNDIRASFNLEEVMDSLLNNIGSP